MRLWALLLALLCGLAAAQDVQPVPALSGRVVDTAGVLGATQRGALEAKLAAFESRSGPQIVLLLMATTQPEDIASYAQRVADAWKIGRREVGDGVLLVVARDDRRVRIEVAKALEGAIPDLAARQIIDQAIRPAFKNGDYAGGLNAGIDRLVARIEGEHLPAPAHKQRGAGTGFDWQQMAVLLFVGVTVAGAVLTSMLGRKLGSLATAAGAGGLAWWLSASVLVAGAAGVAALVLVGLLGIGAARSRGAGHGGFGGLGGGAPVIWGGGGSGGGSDGGGFSSGGGGDFGGGGASGDW